VKHSQHPDEDEIVNTGNGNQYAEDENKDSNGPANFSNIQILSDDEELLITKKKKSKEKKEEIEPSPLHTVSPITNTPHHSSNMEYETSMISNATERVILNVGGKRFESYVSTLTKYPNSLLGAMFSERNLDIRKPDSKGEYFFDRSSLAFEAILNFYRTGRLSGISNVSKELIEDEVDYWMIPVTHDFKEEKEGNAMAGLALSQLRKKVEPTLTKIKTFIVDIIHKTAMTGLPSFSIEFKQESVEQPQFYAFLSNFSHRELLLHDLLQDNFDVSFNDIMSGQGHSYVLFITLWNRYTRDKSGQDSTTALTKILEELRQGVEVKTSKDDHIITVKNINL